MTDAPKVTAEAGSGGFRFPSFEMMGPAGSPLAAQAKLSQAFLENAVAFNQEFSRFACERLKADAHLFHAISECKSVDEAVSAQSDFARVAMESYFAEMPRLMEQAARNSASLWTAAMESAKAMRETASRTGRAAS